MQSLHELLARGEFAIGTVVHMADPVIVELIAVAGYDWISFTLEHATNSAGELVALQRAADVHGLTTLLHVTSLEDPRLLSMLHIGIGGLVLQQTQHREEVEAVIDAVRFPPLGRRGAHAGVRSDRYGAEDYDHFMERANATFLVGVAIEDMTGVEQADALLSVPGVDIAFVGLHDLSHAIGAPNDLRHPRVLEAVAVVREAADRRGIPLGLPGYAHTITELRELGADLVVSPGSELSFIRKAFTEHVSSARAEAAAAPGPRADGHGR